MCPASAKAVNDLAVRFVKQRTEVAGFRAGSNSLVLHSCQYVSIIYNVILI